MPERKFALTGDRTYNHKVMSPTLSYPGGAKGEKLMEKEGTEGSGGVGKEGECIERERESNETGDDGEGGEGRNDWER